MPTSILRIAILALLALAIAACTTDATPTPTATPGQQQPTPTTQLPTPTTQLPTADVTATAGEPFEVGLNKSALVGPANLYVEALSIDRAARQATLRLTAEGSQPTEISLRGDGAPVQYGGYALTARDFATEAGQPSIVLDVQAAQKVVDANTAFAFDLLQELRKQDGDGNLFMSPLSISMALTMTYNGADGETKTAMEETLRLRGLDIHEINAGNAALLEALAGREPDLVLNIANSLWAREGVEFDEAFFERVARYFNAEVESVPFDDAAKDRINGWVSEATNGKIDSILDQISPNDILYLINAIYFNASWVYQFQEEDTKDETFHNAEGTEATVPMMHQGWAKYDYLDGDGFSALRLPYKGGASMVIFLPDEDSSLPEFMDGLNAEAWAEWMDGFQNGGGDIALPRFEIEYEATLNDVLKAMGMEIAFGGGADFSKMGRGGAFISYVKHKAVIEVHELGTEAAAATIVAVAGSAPAFHFDFRADRPFFHAIVDDRTGSVLFTGTVYEL